MPISVRIIDDTYTVLLCEGEVGVDDFVKANDYIYSELDKNLSQFQIVDLNAATNIELSAANLNRIADQDAKAVENLEHVVIAVVAPRDLAYGLSRMWEAYADNPGVTTAVFRELTTAQEWILSIRKKIISQE